MKDHDQSPGLGGPQPVEVDEVPVGKFEALAAIPRPWYQPEQIRPDGLDVAAAAPRRGPETGLGDYHTRSGGLVLQGVDGTYIIWRSRISSRVLQSMHRVAVGRASSLAIPISTPQLSQ